MPGDTLSTTGADLFAQSLKAHGIDTVYGVPGEENTALVQAFTREGIELVLVRHEQSAAYIASVEARLTGKPSACLSTLGPGAINLLGGVADAQLDHAPVLAITAQAPRERQQRTFSHQVIDLDALFAPVTKFTRTLGTAEEIPGAVAEALRVAASPRPGAAHLSLPQDVAWATMKATEALPAAETEQGLPAPQSILRGADVIARAKRPVVLAGAGVLRGDAHQPLVAFLRASGLPMAHTLAATGLLAAEDPLMLGPVGLPVSDHADIALEAADLIVAIGFDPEEVPAARFTDDGRVPVLSVSERALPADTGWALAGEVMGSIGSCLRGLTRTMEGLAREKRPLFTDAKRAHEARRADLENPDADSLAPLNPRQIFGAVQRALHPEDLVISGVGLHKMAAARLLSGLAPGQIVIPNGLAGMGICLPGTIAAARTLAAREIAPETGRALGIAGDGELLMNVQEMETAARLKLPVTLLVLVDGGYGLIEGEQIEETGQSTDLSFTNPRFDDLARSFGWAHTPIGRSTEVASALRDAREVAGPVLITCPTLYDDDIAVALGKPANGAAA